MGTGNWGTLATGTCRTSTFPIPHSPSPGPRPMSSNTHDIVLAPLFDRLIDQEPMESVEIRPMRGYSPSLLIESVRQEVERLLYSRIDTTPVLRSGLRTVLDYGVPDWSGFFPPSQENQRRLRDAVTESLKVFEPRLQRVQVEVARVREQNALQIRIDAMLVVEPVSEPVSFSVVIKDRDSSIEVDTSE